MKIIDKVGAGDGGSLVLRRGKSVVEHRALGLSALGDRPIIEDASPEGWVRLFLRERGKIVPGSHREGKNVWTNTGKEYLALHQTIKVGTPPVGYPDPSPYRVDLVAYIGVGTGSQVASPGVLSLASPVAYSGGPSGTFLAPISGSSFPLTPVNTTVEYRILFLESHISQTIPSTVDVSEIGLFTNGDPATDRASGPRNTTMAQAPYQAPLAYNTFEPVGKRHDLELEIFWQVRY